MSNDATTTEKELINAARDRWHEADYSWEGLRNKSWREGESLQDYWRNGRTDDQLRKTGELIEVQGQKTYHIVHLPPQYKDGTLTSKATSTIESKTHVNKIIIDKYNDESSKFNGVNFSSTYPFYKILNKNINDDLSDCIFASSVQFSNNNFFYNNTFENSVFMEAANFNKANFRQFADFGIVHFIGEARFRKVNFEEEADFSAVLFNKNASFDSATFANVARFEETTFNKKLDFSHCHFENYVNFKQITWPENPIDHHDAFNNAIFKDLANFEGSGFKAFAAFNGARFEQGVRLDKPTSEAKADEQFKDELAAIEKEAKRYGIEILDKNSQLFYMNQKSPHDYRINLLQVLEGGCRVLKQEMAKQSDKNTEQLLYKFELIARREQLKPKSPEWLVSHAYRLVSDYGASIGRPIVSLLATAFIFFPLIYALFFNVTGNFWSFDNLYYVQSASIGRVFQFGTNVDLIKEYINQLNGTGKPWSVFWFNLCGTLESLISLVLLFLMGLAVKRKFQIS